MARYNGITCLGFISEEEIPDTALIESPPPPCQPASDQLCLSGLIDVVQLSETLNSEELISRSDIVTRSDITTQKLYGVANPSEGDVNHDATNGEWDLCMYPPQVVAYPVSPDFAIEEINDLETVIHLQSNYDTEVDCIFGEFNIAIPTGRYLFSIAVATVNFWMIYDSHSPEERADATTETTPPQTTTTVTLQSVEPTANLDLGLVQVDVLSGTISDTSQEDPHIPVAIPEENPCAVFGCYKLAAIKCRDGCLKRLNPQLSNIVDQVVSSLGNGVIRLRPRDLR